MSTPRSSIGRRDHRAWARHRWISTPRAVALELAHGPALQDGSHEKAVDTSDLGAATSGVTYFRSMGGSFGTTIFGSIFSSRVSASSALCLGGAARRVAPQRPAQPRLHDLARELDAGRAGADDPNVSHMLRSCGSGSRSAISNAPNIRRAAPARRRSSSMSRRVTRELRVTEVRLLGARGEDHAVVGHLAVLAKR